MAYQTLAFKVVFLFLHCSRFFSLDSQSMSPVWCQCTVFHIARYWTPRKVRTAIFSIIELFSAKLSDQFVQHTKSMKYRCKKAICAGMGTFEGSKCPGSDDEDGRHCADCGQLWSTYRGSICELCEQFWCDDYQALFVQLDCPSLLDEEECKTQPDDCCPRCFISFEHLWCKKPDCLCSCKFDVVNEQYNRYPNFLR